MSKFKNKNIDFVSDNRIVAHLLFWSILFVFDFLRDLIVNFEGQNTTIVIILIHNLADFLTIILVSYFIVYYLIAKLVNAKKYVLAFFLFLLVVYLIGALSRILIVHVVEPLTRKPPYEQESIQEIVLDFRYLLSHYIPSVLINSLVFISVKSILDKEREKAKTLLLSKEKTEIELKTLKAQLNPHFLFNTLNNIYSLSLVGSSKTSEAIAKLSEILDYLLYKSEGKFVAIKNEVILLENYIELEKLRYDDRLKISFDITIEDEVEVPPLLLLSLVENAFKHGAGEDSGSPTIIISLKVMDGFFKFKVANSVANSTKEYAKNTIGLPNIKKQLDMIYNDAYTLEISNFEKQFVVILTIKYRN